MHNLRFWQNPSNSLLCPWSPSAAYTVQFKCITAYLEGKALELLTLQFIGWAEDSQKTAKSMVLRADDIERLHQAKHILITNLENPPSLCDLAQLVGVNDRKLKQGFRQVFGTTVFGYFQAYRMEQAKQLLQQQTLSVAGVAHTVGYTSPSRLERCV